MNENTKAIIFKLEMEIDGYGGRIYCKSCSV